MSRLAERVAPTREQAPTVAAHGWVLYLGPFVTMFDRFSIAPLLLPIARDFHADLARVATVATLYYFIYGGMQIVWGILSDRFGRVRIMRIALLGIGVAGSLSAVAPTLELLILARAITGAFVAAIVSTSLVYIGDTFPFRIRQRAIADLGTAVAIGTGAATLGAGLLADFLSWRLTFAIPAAVGIALAAAYRWLPESLGQSGSANPLTQVRRVMARGWMKLLIPVGLNEGIVLYGFLTYLAPALEARGYQASTAGIVVAVYGLAVLASTQLVKRLTGHVGGHLLLGAGAAMLVVAYASAMVVQNIPTILAASILAGGSFGFMHSTLQTWVTDVVPDARGTATALFAAALFTGAAIGTAIVAPLAEAQNYHLLFLVAALATVPLMVAGSVARAKYASA